MRPLVELFADTPIWDDMDDSMIMAELLQGKPPEELEELLSVEPEESVGKHLHALAHAWDVRRLNDTRDSNK